MARGVKKNEDDEGGPGHGSNVPDGKVVLEFVDRIENLHGDLGKEKSESMTRCKVIHTDIKEVYKDAKKLGLRKKALKAIIDERSLKAKLDAIPGSLEGDDDTNYAAIKLGLEKLGDLGAAALKAAA